MTTPCRLAAMHQAMKKAALTVPFPEGVSINSTQPDGTEVANLEYVEPTGVSTQPGANFDLNLILNAIDLKMRTLTINKYIAQAGPYPGLSVAWGNQPIYDPNFDEAITRATADKYIGLSVAADWDPYYELYDDNGIYMIRTGAGLDTPPAVLAIGNCMIIKVLGEAITSLAPYFKTAPGDNYVIKGNMLIYYLQNTLVFPGTGDLYDFPNIVIWFLNPNGKISFEMDIYDLVSAGQIVNGFFGDLEGGSSGLGRPANALPVPEPPGAGPLPTLKSLDDFQKTVDVTHRLVQRAKSATIVAKGADKIYSEAYPLAEVRAAFNVHLAAGNLLRAMELYYFQYDSQVVYLPNDMAFTAGRAALKDHQNAALAAMPSVKINRIDFYTIKGNQCSVLVWFDLVGKSGKLYTAPKLIQFYYGGQGRFAFQEDFLDQVTFDRITASYLADQ